MATRILARAALVASVALATPLAAQVQTEVPPVVPGARPAAVEDYVSDLEVSGRPCIDLETRWYGGSETH